MRKKLFIMKGQKLLIGIILKHGNIKVIKQDNFIIGKID